MPKGTLVADPRCRKAGALSSDGSEGDFKALRRSTRPSTAPAGRAAAGRSVMSTLSILVGGLLLLLTAISVWFHDQQPKSYLQLRREALEVLHRSRDQPASEPLVLFGSSLADLSSVPATTVRGIVYVPAYSALRDKIGRSRIHFATTLSIHNTSPDKNLILERVDYHNTEGERVQEYLERAVALKPYGTIEVFVSRDDLRGGTGANFVVHWSAPEQTTKPIIEAVMLGSTGSATYSFVSHGRTVED